MIPLTSHLTNHLFRTPPLCQSNFPKSFKPVLIHTGFTRTRAYHIHRTHATTFLMPLHTTFTVTMHTQFTRTTQYLTSTSRPLLHPTVRQTDFIRALHTGSFPFTHSCTFRQHFHTYQTFAPVHTRRTFILNRPTSTTTFISSRRTTLIHTRTTSPQQTFKRPINRRAIDFSPTSDLWVRSSVSLNS